jgi:hypothetical protein
MGQETVKSFPRKDLLHALLAVEPDLKGKSEKIIQETINTFKGKQAHFKSLNRNYEPVKEDGLKLPSEEKEMVDTVTDKLAYTQKNLIKTIDTVFQKELTNLEAKADLEVDGIVLAENVPATALLNLETRLKKVRDVYQAIPTLPPGKLWEKDPEREHVYRTQPLQKHKMEKELHPVELSPATDKHPAQVEKVYKDVAVGVWTEIERNSSWTSAEKSEKLGRIDTLIEGVKQSRQAANTTLVRKDKIGKILFDYINRGVVH